MAVRAGVREAAFTVEIAAHCCARSASVRRCRWGCACRLVHGDEPPPHHHGDPVREFEDLVEVGRDQDDSGWGGRPVACRANCPRTIRCQLARAGRLPSPSRRDPRVGDSATSSSPAAQELPSRNDLLLIAAGERVGGVPSGDPASTSISSHQRPRRASLDSRPSQATGPLRCEASFPWSARATFSDDCEVLHKPFDRFGPAGSTPLLRGQVGMVPVSGLTDAGQDCGPVRADRSHPRLRCRGSSPRRTCTVRLMSRSAGALPVPTVTSSSIATGAESGPDGSGQLTLCFWLWSPRPPTFVLARPASHGDSPSAAAARPPPRAPVAAPPLPTIASASARFADKPPPPPRSARASPPSQHGHPIGHGQHLVQLVRDQHDRRPRGRHLAEHGEESVHLAAAPARRWARRAGARASSLISALRISIRCRARRRPNSATGASSSTASFSSRGARLDLRCGSPDARPRPVRGPSLHR